MAQNGFKRKLTSILSADVVGYSRLMGEDEEATVRTLTAYREAIGTLINENKGRANSQKYIRTGADLSSKNEG